MANTGNELESYRLTSPPDWGSEREIGRGGFGIVFEAHVRRPGMLRHELCAVKRISKANHIFPRESYEREIANFARLLKHEWFVQFFGWHEDDNYLYIAMEHMELGDLEQHINFKWTEEDTLVVASQLLQGLTVMHSDGIIHRDLKPANIYPTLLDHTSLRVKIGDFGVSKRISDSTIAETQTGSMDYMAPEVLYQSVAMSYTNSVDLWALGCILYRMIVGKLPFSNPEEIFRYKYGLMSFPRPGLESSNMSEGGIKFMESLIQPDPTRRMTAGVALNSDWITAKPSGFQVTEQLVRHLDRAIRQKPKLLGTTGCYSFCLHRSNRLIGFSCKEPDHHFYIVDNRFRYCIITSSIGTTWQNGYHLCDNYSGDGSLRFVIHYDEATAYLKKHGPKSPGEEGVRFLIAGEFLSKPPAIKTWILTNSS